MFKTVFPFILLYSKSVYNIVEQKLKHHENWTVFYGLQAHVWVISHFGNLMTIDSFHNAVWIKLFLNHVIR